MVSVFYEDEVDSDTLSANLRQIVDVHLEIATLEPDGQAAGCNPAEVGSIPTGVSDGQLPVQTTSV